MPLSRRDALKGLLAGTVGTLTGAGVYGAAYERHQVGLTEAVLTVSGLPPALGGLRVGFITDIHHSSLVPAEDITRAVERLTANVPDLIVLGGDYVTLADRAFMAPVAELLAPLHAPLGVFAILGNHDDDRAMPAALARQHFTVLRDQRTTIAARGEHLDLAGIRFWTRRPAEIARVLKGARHTTLLLAHDPRRLTEAAALNVPAVLSGHTHGGQIVLPGIGAIAKGRFPVVHGVGRRENTSLFVSRGLGTVYVPVRINCPPEVVLLTLQPPSQDEAPPTA